MPRRSMQPSLTHIRTEIRAIPFCWLRLAPASINSRVMNTAAKSSSKSSAGCNRKDKMSQRLKTDWVLFATVLAMVSFGLLILYSASSIMAKLDPRFHSSWYFVFHQAAWAALAIAIMMVLKKTNYRKLNNSAVAFTAIGITLILLALVYLFDSANHRWLRIGAIGL